MKKWGGELVEQLLVKGGSYVPKSENYGVFCFHVFLMFVCVFLQKHYEIGVSANFGHCFFWGGGGAKS